MRMAGAGDAFLYARSHTSYACAAQKWRTKGDRAKFWAYRVNEAAPEIGDLVCRDRPVEGRPCAGTTYDTVCKGGSSHCDIVVGVDRDKNRIWVLGGNVANSVSCKPVVLGPGGFLPTHVTKGCQWIGVLKPPPHPA
jgi:hypothetical protein